MTLEEATEFLEGDLWKKSHGDKVTTPFYKTFASKVGCACNNPDGTTINVCLEVHNWHIYQEGRDVSFELSIHAQLDQALCAWTHVKLHALPSDVAEAVKYVPQLVHMWEAGARFIYSETPFPGS